MEHNLDAHFCKDADESLSNGRKVFPDKDSAFPNPSIPSLCYIKNVMSVH